LKGSFRNSWFGQYLDLPLNNNARFEMSIVYEFLERRFMFEDNEKKDEIWVNYCDTPL